MVHAEGNIFFDVSNADFQIGMGSVQVFNSTDVPRAVVDGGVMTSTLNVPSSIEIADINVSLDISHTYDEDLIVQLISPMGTNVTLFSGVGGSLDNFTATTLDDEAATSINAGTPPFTGSFMPHQPLSAFDSQDGLGTWTLRVEDTSLADGGTLNSWSIAITPPPTIPGADNVYVDFDYGGAESGTMAQPFNTLGEGLTAVNPGGTLWIEPGTTSEAPLIDQDVTLRSNGPEHVFIGATP